MAFRSDISFINLLGCPIHAITMEETILEIDRCIHNNIHIQHVVVNAAKLVNMKKDRNLLESVVCSDIINADGQAVVWAARLLGKFLPERVAGIDLMGELVNLAHKRGYKIFFLGAEEEIVRRVVDIYSNKYGSAVVAGFRNGYFSADQEQEVATMIQHSGADILFVAMTSPKKEIFLNKFKEQLNMPFIMGVGGSFDVVSGKTKRAPLWMQKGGLEWLYRVYQEPRRMWKRYLITNTKFIFYIIKEKFK